MHGCVARRGAWRGGVARWRGAVAWRVALGAWRVALGARRAHLHVPQQPLHHPLRAREAAARQLREDALAAEVERLGRAVGMCGMCRTFCRQRRERVPDLEGAEARRRAARDAVIRVELQAVQRLRMPACSRHGGAGDA